MTLRTDLTDADAQSTLHAAQHNEVNTDVIALQASSGSIPADSNGATTATVTPDPISGAHSMTVIEVAAEQTILAWKVTGDSYPRVIFTAHGAFYIGDGTYDPSIGGTFINLASGGLTLGGTTAAIQVDVAAGTNRSRVAKLGALGLQLNNGVGQSGAALYSGSGAPGIGAEVGDIWFRTGTPSTANQRIYICTVAGGSGVATWVGIV